MGKRAFPKRSDPCLLNLILLEAARIKKERELAKEHEMRVKLQLEEAKRKREEAEGRKAPVISNVSLFD